MQEIRSEISTLRSRRNSIIRRSTPLENVQKILEKAGTLNIFFVDNTRFPLGVISIRDARYSTKQTKYGIALTVLASIYLP